MLRIDRLALGSALVFGSGFLVACGGATVTDLQGNPPPGGQDAGTDTSVVKDSSVIDEGIGVDVSPPPPPPPIDAGPPDVIKPPDIAPIVCGQALATASMKCDANKEVCCRSGSGVQMTVACNSGSTCPNVGSVPLACSTTTTCTALGLVNNVCCGTVNGNSQVTSAKCVPEGSCPGTNGTIRLCDKNGPNVCPVNTTCKTSSFTLAGYDLCF